MAVAVVVVAVAVAVSQRWPAGDRIGRITAFSNKPQPRGGIYIYMGGGTLADGIRTLDSKRGYADHAAERETAE